MCGYGAAAVVGALAFLGRRPNEGHSPKVRQRYGEAEPRLTSGGKADSTVSALTATLTLAAPPDNVCLTCLP